MLLCKGVFLFFVYTEGEAVYNCGGRWGEVVYNVHVVGDSGML